MNPLLAGDPMSALRQVHVSIQQQLFPVWEEEIGELSAKEQQFLRVLALVEVERFMAPFRWKWLGRKPKDRLPIARAFIAKAIWNLHDSKAVRIYLIGSASLRRLCGWESVGQIPSEATFSRAFAAFARGQLPQRIHEALVKRYLGRKLIGHISRDSTAIPARERPVAKPPPPPRTPKKRGRPPKGQPPPAKTLTRLMLQGSRSLEVNLADLPQRCDTGCKRNSQGYRQTWRGYKLHLDCADGDIPISALLTSASLHDSQAAIPLAQMSKDRVCNLYDLMDSAYAAPLIAEFSRRLGHVPLIEPNPHWKNQPTLDPAALLRFRERSTVERVHSNLLDNFGGRWARVRGAIKIMCHLMFSIVALTAVQLFRLLE